MPQAIERITYQGGMLKRGRKPKSLPSKVWRGDEIPSAILKQIQDDDILNFGGKYGDPYAGDPVQYDCLTIVLTGTVVKIEFYNRVIAIIGSDDEKLRRIFHIMSVLDQEPE